MSRDSQPSSLLMRVCELLDDRQWHDLEAVMRELAKLIPPGVAIRRNEHDRSVQSEGRPRHIPMSAERQIQAGKRALARDTMRARWFEKTKRSDGRVYVRMTRMPQSVANARAHRARANFDPSRICDELANESLDIEPLLSRLTRAQTRALAQELTTRVRTRMGVSSESDERPG